MPSITNLHSSIKSFSKKLERKYNVVCEITKVPSWNNYRYGSPSHVLLYVYKYENHSHGKTKTLIANFKFIANGYCSHRNNEFGGDSIKEMKDGALKYLQKLL